ncbi:hypothetical protein F511_16965 [Dorcoceras hygrometricum]|uniref:Uncharacterized protein n=1 Tax=Dorcoceras hygrometricum TaxID=472368 RepID=A0A2Z7BMZ0_9LAMI|nr:hypothetical protein F511_16965 [Dorcoceras hygrometricum]
MPLRREGGRRTRRSAEGSRAGSDDDAQVENVTRQIGEMELVLARFQRTNPPKFAGTEGGARAEAWLVHMEEIFDTLEYVPEKRLKLAVLQLRDDAQRWWRGTSRMLRDSWTILTWDGFCEAVVKRKYKSKKKSETTDETPVEIIFVVAGSKKRPAAEDSAPVNPKKRRTVKGKANLDVVPVAQDVVPLQIIEPIPAATVVKSPAPKRISRKRRLVLPTGSEDENMDTQEPVKDTDEIAEKHTDEIDDIIRQITAETSKMGSDEKEQEEQRVDETDIGDDFDQWLEESFKDFVDMDKAVGSKHTEEEHMSIDDLLLQISDDMMLPSVTAAEIKKIRLGESININEVQERDWYYASLPRISTHDKGKEPLEENEPVRGNPAKETVELICGDVDFLVQLRDKQKEHGIIKDQPSSSQLFKDIADNSGAVLAKFYSMAKSTCWPVQYSGAAPSLIYWGTTADPDHASQRGSGRTKIGPGDDQYNSINMQAMTIHRVFSLITLLATRAWLRPVSRGNRHFTVGDGRLRQSGSRPEVRLLRQPTLEGLMRSTRTDSPRQVGRNKFRRERRRRRRLLREERGAATWR